MSRILVLEDMPKRVEHLITFFPDVEINWVTTVSAFRASAAHRPPDIYILDCDLGGPFVGSADENGETGLDAARWLRTDKPVAVWSWNPTGGPLMVAALQANNVRAIWNMFSDDFSRWLVLHPWFSSALRADYDAGLAAWVLKPLEATRE